jgi:hypothetical protein
VLLVKLVPRPPTRDRMVSHPERFFLAFQLDSGVERMRLRILALCLILSQLPTLPFSRAQNVRDPQAIKVGFYGESFLDLRVFFQVVE